MKLAGLTVKKYKTEKLFKTTKREPRFWSILSKFQFGYPLSTSPLVLVATLKFFLTHVTSFRSYLQLASWAA